MHSADAEPGSTSVNGDRSYVKIGVESGVWGKPHTGCCQGSRSHAPEEEGNVEDQNSERVRAGKKLKRALVICVFFMVAEVVGGSLAGSLAILTDAAHLLSDVAGFAISLVALGACHWLPNNKYTYGYVRVEVLGALASVLIIWFMTGCIVFEAVHRLFIPSKLVDGRLMCLIAILGMAVNVVMIFVLDPGQHHNGGACAGHSHFKLSGRNSNDAGESGVSLKQIRNSAHTPMKTGHVDEHSLFSAGKKVTVIETLPYFQSDENKLAADKEELAVLVREDPVPPSEGEKHHTHADHGCETGLPCKAESHNINLRGAYLHALGDLIQSLGVLITGIIIWVKPEWQLVDLLCSILFSAVVVSTTFAMMRDVLSILLESTPLDVDMEAVNTGLLGIPGVVEVQQLHVWALTIGTYALTCHLYIASASGVETRDVLNSATRFCKNTLKMKYVTIQLEDSDKKRDIAV